MPIDPPPSLVTESESLAGLKRNVHCARARDAIASKPQNPFLNYMVEPVKK